jgi:hypothetical protein
MSEQFDPFDETIRMWEGGDTIRVEVGDTEVMNAAVAVEELMRGDAETVPSEDSAAWDSKDLSRVARQLDRYRCRRTSWF